MKYSVVIPLYNKQQYIQNTIQSVLSQSFDDFEIIVVDDGSKDDSLNQARLICSPKVRIIEQENQGVAVARNTGIQNVHDEAVMEMPVDKGSMEHACAVMGQPPDWALDLPLRADGYECAYYRKD